MRVVVLSDTHRDFFAFERVLRAQPAAEVCLFLGDGLDECADAASLHPRVAFHAVRGNCDRMADEPSVRWLEVGGVPLVMTHGHEYGAKGGAERLLRLGRDYGARLVFYGHTHCASVEYVDGIYLINPGSAARPRDGAPSYACVDIVPAGVLPFIVRL